MYFGVDMRKVVDVPRDTMASSGRRGRERIVAGLSPVNGIIEQDGENEKREVK